MSTSSPPGADALRDQRPRQAGEPYGSSYEPTGRYSLPPYPPQYYASVGPMAPATSGWAIASFVCAIAGFVGIPGIGNLLGVIFGFIALSEIERSQGRVEGHGMAVAGIALGFAGLALVAALIVLAFVFWGTFMRHGTLMPLP